MEEEDDLLQFAIQQSLIDAGTEKEEVCNKSINSPLLFFDFKISGGYLGGAKGSEAFPTRHAKFSG